MNNGALKITSLLSLVLLTLHVTDDIVRGISKAESSNTALVVLVILLYGTLVLAERPLGHVLMFLVGLLAAAMPVMHMRGAHYPQIAASTGGFFFVWTLWALGALGGVTMILSVRGLWSLRRRPRAEKSAIRNEQAPDTKGVTVQLLATVDLGAEIEGMAGRQLRMRMVTMEPGSVFGPIHDHKDRPGTVYILQGTITDHRNGTSTEYGPGPGWPEDRNTMHWLENRGTVPAVEISVDIVRRQ